MRRNDEHTLSEGALGRFQGTSVYPLYAHGWALAERANAVGCDGGDIEVGCGAGANDESPRRAEWCHAGNAWRFR